MKKKWILGVMALGLVLGTYSCSGNEEATDESSQEEAAVTDETKKELEDMKDLESEAIMLDAELDAFIESL